MGDGTSFKKCCGREVGHSDSCKLAAITGKICEMRDDRKWMLLYDASVIKSLKAHRLAVLSNMEDFVENLFNG